LAFGASEDDGSIGVSVAGGADRFPRFLNLSSNARFLATTSPDFFFSCSSFFVFWKRSRKEPSLEKMLVVVVDLDLALVVDVGLADVLGVGDEEDEAADG